MSPQPHIINRQVLEIHLDNKADVNAMQEDIRQLFHEKLLPIINDICDRLGPADVHHKIEKLDIDLGNVHLKEIEEVFAEKFAEALTFHKADVSPLIPLEAESASEQKTPLDALSYYLMTGTLPWWVPSPDKDYLLQLLNALNEAPNSDFKALISQIGLNKAYRERFINTFSEAQILKSLRSLTSLSLDELPKIKQEIAQVVLRKPEWFSPGLTTQKVTTVFWATVFTHVPIANNHSDLMSLAIHQTLRSLGADFGRVLNNLQEKQTSSGITKWIDPKTNTQIAGLTEVWEQLEKIRIKYRDIPLLQAFCAQLTRLLSHSLFSRIDARQIQLLGKLLQDLVAAQEGTNTTNATILRVVTETNLEPLSRHLHYLDAQLRQMESSNEPNVLEKSLSTFDDTDFITVQNAGLVIFWPFLQRFFENLDLLSDKGFTSESAKHKAACVLQYLADEEEEGLFEGLLTLNKVLCGINLSEPIAIEPLSDNDKEVAEGLLQAVISHGPNWKNLSLPGLRTSYLQREGLLRGRDGHWLLQVKKETYDITLQKLPWGFSTVKLPWMNEILIVEWI